MIYNGNMVEDSELWLKLINTTFRCIGWFCWLVALGWAVAGVLCFPDLQFGIGLSLVSVVLGGLLFAAIKFGDRHILIYGVWCFDVLVLLSLFAVRPNARREWATDMDRSIEVAQDQDVLVLKNVRDFVYDSETEFTESWIEKRVPLSGLQRVWLGVEQIATWEGVAHIFVTFEYLDEQGQANAIAVSAEIHRERGEEFAVLPGLYRNFELTYVVGTERDLIGLRTHVRKDPVRLYPLTIPPKEVAVLFQDVMDRAVRLQHEPEFYHTIANNCASNILYHLNKLAPQPISKWDKRVIFSGMVDRIAYSLNVVPDVTSLKQMRAKYLVDISGFEIDEHFSQRLREIGMSVAEDPEVNP